MAADDAPKANGWAMYIRLFVAFVGTVLLFSGVGLQIFSAGNLYGVPLSLYCQAYSGTPDLATAQSLKEMLSVSWAARQSCLALNGTQRDDCCAQIGGYTGLCVYPGVKTISTASNISAAHEKMKIITAMLGDFFGVAAPNQYRRSNAEFWCKNCPNDYRKNCPFIASDTGESGFTNAKVCNCPGGVVSKPGQPFWSTIGDAALAADFTLCTDRQSVYRAWLQAAFPEFNMFQIDDAANRFLNKCYQDKAGLGYILSIGPALGIISCILCIGSLLKYFANSPMPVVGFEIAMLAIALEFVSFWPLSFTGAATLISRYTFCAGYSYPVVLNASLSTTLTGPRAAPVFYNGSPCYDLNSEGAVSPNPFVQQLGIFNAGYVSGGALVIIALICMLAVVSKHSDAIFELKLAGQLPARGGKA